MSLRAHVARADFEFRVLSPQAHAIVPTLNIFVVTKSAFVGFIATIFNN